MKLLNGAVCNVARLGCEGTALNLRAVDVMVGRKAGTDCCSREVQ